MTGVVTSAWIAYEYTCTWKTMNQMAMQLVYPGLCQEKWICKFEISSEGYLLGVFFLSCPSIFVQKYCAFLCYYLCLSCLSCQQKIALVSNTENLPDTDNHRFAKEYYWGMMPGSHGMNATWLRTPDFRHLLAKSSMNRSKSLLCLKRVNLQFHRHELSW
jgi:hypothetical protein